MWLATQKQQLTSYDVQSPRPALIILDMNLPDKPGEEVLGVLKSDNAICNIPVVVFSSSDAVRDVQAAYRAHASSYIRKPVDVDEFFAVVAGMERYWTGMVILPSS